MVAVDPPRHKKKRPKTSLSWQSSLQVLLYILVIAAARQYLGVEIPWLMPGNPLAP
jgi:hypothetical protein